jgi:hypothetical protein
MNQLTSPLSHCPQLRSPMKTGDHHSMWGDELRPAPPDPCEHGLSVRPFRLSCSPRSNNSKFTSAGFAFSTNIHDPLLSPGRPPPHFSAFPGDALGLRGLPLPLCHPVSAPSSQPGRLDLHIPPHAPCQLERGGALGFGWLADGPARASALSSLRCPPRLSLTLLPLGSLALRLFPAWPLPFPSPVQFRIQCENDPNPARNRASKTAHFSPHFKLFPAAQRLPSIAKRHL